MGVIVYPIHDYSIADILFVTSQLSNENLSNQASKKMLIKWENYKPMKYLRNLEWELH